MAGAEEGEEEAIEATEADPEPAEAAEVEPKAGKVGTEARDIHPRPQRPVVNATTFMVTKLGTAWHPSHVPGSTRWLQEPEIQTSLTRRISKID